jgi:hypothetical protein
VWFVSNVQAQSTLMATIDGDDRSDRTWLDAVADLIPRSMIIRGATRS